MARIFSKIIGEIRQTRAIRHKNRLLKKYMPMVFFFFLIDRDLA
jgi:hypothetical protein